MENHNKIQNLLGEAHSPGGKEFFETLFNAGNVKIERIVSRGHTTPDGEYYDQDWNEWVAVIKGTAVLKLIDPDEVVNLKEGDCFFLPAHRKHRVEYTDISGTIWLAFHFSIKTYD